MSFVKKKKYIALSNEIHGGKLLIPSREHFSSKGSSLNWLPKQRWAIKLSNSFAIDSVDFFVFFFCQKSTFVMNRVQ